MKEWNNNKLEIRSTVHEELRITYKL